MGMFCFLFYLVFSVDLVVLEFGHVGLVVELGGVWDLNFVLWV
jgi:hypothetical protein